MQLNRLSSPLNWDQCGVSVLSSSLHHQHALKLAWDQHWTAAGDGRVGACGWRCEDGGLRTDVTTPVIHFFFFFLKKQAHAGRKERKLMVCMELILMSGTIKIHKADLVCFVLLRYMQANVCLISLTAQWARCGLGGFKIWLQGESEVDLKWVWKLRGQHRNSC